MDPFESRIEKFHIDPYLFYDAIEKSTDNYIYIVDMDTDTALVSKNMWLDFDLPSRFVPGLIPLWGDLIHEKDKSRYFDAIEAMLDGETSEHNVEYQVKNRKGEYIWVVCRGHLQENSEGKPVMFAGVVTDLGSKGKIDHTTGLFTHLECEKRINALLSSRTLESAWILLLGLDDFVRINDLNSHIFGDAVLRQFAQGVQQLLPPEAEMYRFDGDEFAILYRGATRQDLETLYRKIYTYSNRIQQIDGTSYYCTVSAGIAMLGRDGENYPELLKCATSALEVSKRNGKNTFTFFSPKLMQAKLRALEISNQLQLSVLGGMKQFSLVYQPFAHSKGLKLAGAEALLRWSSDALGSVSPVEFVPLLESSGLVVPVGRWILEEAVKTCKKWSAYQSDFVMHINISYLQLLDREFVPFVEQMLKKYQLDPQHIVLELTESYFVTDMGALKEIFLNLRALNVKIAMDDFGTGYSSLGMLSQTPADIVKVDRLFIKAINTSKNTFNRSFIGSVIDLCHSVGIKVCVEGVECLEELQAVCSLNVDNIQGFYFSRPIPPEVFEQRYWKLDTVDQPPA